MTRAGADRSRGIYLHSVAAMGTVVTIQIVEAASRHSPEDRQHLIDRALEWFARVEACCSRFDPASEVSRLSASPGVAVPVSTVLFEAVRFSLAVASASDGAFDPTVGREMAARGFNQDYRTGEVVSSESPAARVSYRDVELDSGTQSVRLHRPLMLDLGAVAKGLAVDLAARELRPLGHFAIDAGGDLYLAGRNADDDLWTAGIRHPRDSSRLLGVIRASDAALCTSGDYARQGREGAGHILDARSRDAAARSASATVVAPTTIAADALATAAFVLGPEDGVSWLEAQGAEGLIVSPDLSWRATQAFADRMEWA